MSLEEIHRRKHTVRATARQAGGSLPRRSGPDEGAGASGGSRRGPGERRLARAPRVNQRRGARAETLRRGGVGYLIVAPSTAVLVPPPCWVKRGRTSTSAGRRFPPACEFRRDLGARSGRTWAPVPTHLGTHSGAPGRPFRRIRAPIPEQEVIRAVRRAGARVDSSCGIHIHVDAARFDVGRCATWSRSSKAGAADRARARHHRGAPQPVVPQHRPELPRQRRRRPLAGRDQRTGVAL
jgi:hypothetical protein